MPHIAELSSDYVHTIRSATSMYLHTTPPKHYLDYVVDGKVAVILIPGILGKWGFLKHLGDKISLEGHPVYVVPKLGYNLMSVPRSAMVVCSLITKILKDSKKAHSHKHLAKNAMRIRQLIEQHDIKNVILVAYSKGGLIGKYLMLHCNNDDRIKGMVAIATPFSGTSLVKLIPLDPFQELDNDSRIIHDLQRETAVNRKIISIYPKYDNEVMSDKGSFLEGAENFQMNVSGHHKVLYDKEVEKKVLECIEELSGI